MTREPSESWKVGPHQTPDLLASKSGVLKLQQLRNEDVLFSATQGTVFSYSGPNW